MKQLLSKGIKSFEIDVTDEQSFDRAAKDFGDQTLDVLVNVAAIYNLWDDKPFTELAADDLTSHFQVNVLVRGPPADSALLLHP